MDILITGNNTFKSTNEIYTESKKIGNYYSEDRFYTLINSQIDEGLRKYSIFLYILVIFLFRSTNFKHATDTLNKKPRWVLFVDIFCWLCLIVFIVSLVTGVATPIVVGISAAIKGDTSGFVDAFKNALLNPTTIILFVISVITFIIAIIFLYVLKKVVAVNKKLSLKDFVITKLSMVKRFSGMLDVNKKMKKMSKKSNKFKPDKFYLIKNVEVLNNDNRWLILQISNIMYELFPDLGIILELNNINESDLKMLKTICDSDFRYIKITILND